MGFWAQRCGVRAFVLMAVAVVLTGVSARPASAMGGGAIAWGTPVLGEGRSASGELAQASSPDVSQVPEVSSVSPDGGPPAGGTSVVISGSHFAGVTAVDFGSVEATSVKAKSKTSLTVTSPAGTGTVDVTVTTPEGTSATSPADRFVYGPNVTGVSPDRGPANGGTSVTITGSDFTGATAVEFGSSEAASFEVNSESSITAVSPEGTGTVDVRVIDPEATSSITSADQFSYVAAPTVAGVSPVVGPEAGGTEVAVTGTNFNEVTAVDFGMSPAFYVVNNEGSITAFSPADAGTVDVTVTAFGGTSLTSSADQFTYIPAPIVTAVSPETGPALGGSTVTITGTNLAEATAVDFGSSSAANVVVDSQDSITAISPAGTPGATVDVTVTTLGGTSLTSAADRFRYLQTAPLLVRKVSPNTGALAGGTPVKIIGSGFVGATAVHFGSASATSFTVKGQDEITTVAPAGTGTVDVTVTTPEGTSPKGSADAFTYVASPPTVEAVSPAPTDNPNGGGRVTITGTDFTGATQVRFGSVSTYFHVRSYGKLKGKVITAIEPPLAAVDQSVVDVTVTTPEGTSAITPADKFSYVVPAPAIIGVSPTEGKDTGGTTVSIAGAGFIEVTAVDFGSVSATEFTVNAYGSITATSPAETVGRVDISVTTPAGTSSPGDCWAYRLHIHCPAREHFKVVEPTITNVTPNTGPTVGGTSATITGTGFGLGTTATVVRFGGALATSVDCTSFTTCTVVAPARKSGTVDVRATMNNMPTARTPADQFTYE